MYPFIDLESAGSVEGMIRAADHLLAMIDNKTQLIPGHGPLSDKAAFKAYSTILKTIRDRVKEHIAAGRSLEETLMMKPAKDYDETWGKGFMSPERFLTIVYQDLSKKE